MQDLLCVPSMLVKRQLANSINIIPSKNIVTFMYIQLVASRAMHQ